MREVQAMEHKNGPHCVILAAMPVDARMRAYYEDADIVIAADAGWRSAKALGLVPDLLVGDYDSSPVPAGAEVLPCAKDDTDTHYAARRALAMGAARVTILGGTGGRLDHTLANLQTLLFLERSGVHALLADPDTEARALLPGTHEVRRLPGRYLSLFPADGTARGVTLEGLKFPLQNACLEAQFPLGVSNEFAAETARITLGEGALYLLLCRK